MESNISESKDVELDIEPETEEEIDIFKNTDEIITITEKELVPEYERIYKDDAVYIEDLEESFISELPVEDQNNKYFQERISEKVRKIIEIKNEGNKLLERDENYPKVYDYYINEEFVSNWLIPVVLDKQRIYKDVELTESETKAIDVEEVNLKDQIEEYDSLLKKYKYGEISYEKYLKLSTQLVKPFIILDKYNNKDVGYKLNLKNDTNLLRYFNIGTPKWDERIGTGPIYMTSEPIKKLILLGEQINLVGFFLLPKNKRSLNQLIGTGIGRYNKIGNISAIEKGNKTIITINNHGLSNNDYIMIRGNNYLDGRYKISLIDVNKFSINIDSTNFEFNNFGSVYGSIKLMFNTIDIIKEKNKINLKGKTNYFEPTLFLFNTFSVSNDDYMEIIRIVVPSLNDIMVRQQNELDKSKFLYDINQILMKYMITYDNLTIEQFNIIKKTLEGHVESEEKNIDKLRKEYKPLSTTENKNFVNTIYDNTKFYSDNIVKLYGDYPLKNSIYDSIKNRIMWIEHHIDYGNLYYNFVFDKIDIYDKKQLQESLKNIKATYDRINKTYEKEKSLDKYFNKCSKFIGQFKSLDELESGKDGDIVLIGNKSIYQWKNNKWEFKKDADFSSALYLCALGDDDIKDIDSINCVYTLDGCKSKRSYKYEKILKLMGESMENYEELIKYLDEFKKKISEKIEIAKVLLYNQIVKRKELEEKKIEEVVKIEENIPVTIIGILNAISKIKNPRSRRQLMYQLLEKDGIMIGNIVYSKKYQGYLMCGHYVYMRKEDYTNDNGIKEIMRQKLLTKFGDEGMAESGDQNCKICGAYLNIAKYDECPGFDSEGNPLYVREIWVEENKSELLEKIRQTEKIACRSQQYKEDLIKKGFNIDQVIDGIKFCEILQTLNLKTGINLLKNNFMSIIIDTLEQFVILPKYSSFVKSLRLAYKAKGSSDKKIAELISLGIFEQLYRKFIISKRYSLISARFLIEVQTAVPPYTKKITTTGCTFISWEKKYGVEYIACILKEMKVLRYKIGKEEKEKEIRIEEIINEIYNAIDLFNRKLSIKKLYKKREQYEREKTVPTSVKIIDQPVKIEEAKKVDIKLLEKDYRKFGDELYARLYYLAYKIKEYIKDVINKSQPISPTILPENACCSEKIDNYEYYKFINEQTNWELGKVIEESQEISPYQKMLVHKGTINKLFINPLYIIYVQNRAAYLDITEELIKKKFETFCYKGITTGQYHYFVGKEGNKKCVKCGEYLEQIKKSKFTKDEFIKLLGQIAELSKIIFVEEEYQELVNLEELKKESKTLDGEINNFVDKLAKILGKSGDKVFKDKYKSLLNVLGDYENTYQISDDIDEQYILLNMINDKEENRVYLLKNYINQYFRKYISMVAYEYDVKESVVRVPLVTSTISSELQKYIYDDFDYLSQFFTEDNAEIFKKMKFEYTIDEVNSIYGASDRYNCKWDKIVEHSKFNLKSASDALLYILVSELDKFLLEKNGQNIIAQFIVAIFDIILSDDSIFDMRKVDIEKYKKEIHYYQYCKYYKKMATEGTKAEIDFLKQMGMAQADGTVDIYSLMTEDEELSERQSQIEQREDAIDTYAKTKIGTDATPEELEAFRETFEKNKREEKYIYENEFNMRQPKEGFEILEVGDDYGEMPQGTENEGDGISVYSEQEWINPM